MEESSRMGTRCVLQWKGQKGSQTTALPPTTYRVTLRQAVYSSGLGLCVRGLRSRATFSDSQGFCDSVFELSSSPNEALRFEMCLWVSSSVVRRSSPYEYIHTGKDQRIVKLRSLEVFEQLDLFSKTRSEPAHESIGKVALFSKNLSPACS